MCRKVTKLWILKSWMHPSTSCWVVALGQLMHAQVGIDALFSLWNQYQCNILKQKKNQFRSSIENAGLIILLLLKKYKNILYLKFIILLCQVGDIIHNLTHFFKIIFALYI